MHTTKYSKFLLLGPASVVIALSGCCTDQAAKVRADRHTTVGLVGVAYRPSANAGVVADLNGALGATKIESSLKPDKTASAAATEERKFNTASRRFDLGMHLYPFPKSAFFYGAGAEYLDRTTNFNSPTYSSSLASPETTAVSFNDKVISVGPSVGWDWIWENGFSFFADLGGRIPVSRKHTVLDDGTDGNVNISDRDETQSKINKQINGAMSISAHLMLGYSF